MFEIAVVIATYRRETRLRFALEALAAQTLDPDRYEVIVVRAPGAEGPFAVAPDGIAVRCLTAPDAGPAAQRNHGWLATEAPLIAFTDDDCRASAEWLAALLDAADGDSIVQGRTVPDPDERHLLTGLARTVEVESASGWYETCNIAYPRELLERAGGFDVTFAMPWGEDTELGLRAQAQGASLRFASRALVWHAVTARTVLRAVAEARRREWLPAVIARRPEQRRALYRRWFANRSHAALVAGALALAIAPRRTPAVTAAAAVPFIAHNVAYGRGRGGGLGSLKGILRFALMMPARLTLDLVELGSALRGSARHGTLVI